MTATVSRSETTTRTASVIRVGGAAGLVFAAFGVMSGVISPQPPAADASAATIRAYVVNHASALRASVLMSVAALIGLGLFFVALRRWIGSDGDGRSAIGNIVMGFGLMTSTVALVGCLLQAAVVQGITRSTSDDVVLTLFRLGRIVFYTGPALTSTAALLAAAVATWWWGVLPRWSALLAVVAGLLGLVSGSIDLVDTSGSPAALGFPGFLITVLWTVVAAIVLLRGEAVAAPA